MITVRDLMVRINNDDDLENGLSRLAKGGRIVAVLPQPKNLKSALTYKVVIEQEPITVILPTIDSNLADRLEKLAEAAETGPWFTSNLDGDEDHQVISIGGYDLSERPAKNHHYEDTILEVWDNGNVAGNATDTAALLAELVNNLPTIIKALRNDSSELTVQSFV